MQKRCLNLSFLILALAVTFSCETTKGVASEELSDAERYEGIRELSDYLRTIPGVELRGSGDYIDVYIRGAKSITGDNNPLYVVDGVILGRDYASAARAANSFAITNVSVVPPPRAGRYGARGQNGVIEVTTKRTIE